MASYNPPNPYVPNAFNPTQFITPSDNITTKFLDENYLRFPFAQGTENFVSINNQGSLTQSGLADFSSNTTPAIFNLPPTITNPILDTATTPLNAVATIGYVLANEQGGSDLLPLDNLWTGVNNFNPTPIQPYGGVMTQGITITNNQNSSTLSGENDIISYTPSSTQGLCIFSSSTNSVVGKTSQIELQPDGVKTSLFANGTNGIVQLNALGGTQSKIILQASSGVFLQLVPTINFNNLGTLSASASGIENSVNFTSPSITTPLITQTADNTDITLLGSGLNSSIILNATSGVILRTNPTISFATYGTLTAGIGGLSTSVAIILPAQTTYTPSTTYGNVGATQQFVQQALASQGSGDVTTGGTNDYTGRNTYNFNSNGGTITASGLTLARNVEVGNNELDLVSINSTTNNGLFIYCETTSVSSASTPKIQVYNDGTPTLFNTNITLPTQSQYNPGTTYGNLSATQAFVQSAESGIFTATLSIPITSFVGSQSGFPTPTSSTFKQTYNSKTQTNTLYLTTFYFTASSSTIQFTLTFPTELYPTGSTPSFLAGSGFTYYSSSFGQAFNLVTTFLSSTQIRCSTAPTTTIGGNSQVSGQLLIGWT